MNALDTLLMQLNLGLWLVHLPTFAMFFYVCQRNKKTNSSLLTMLIVLVSGFFIIVYEEALAAYIEAYPDYNSVVTFLWYGGSASFYAVVLFYLRKSHQLRNIQIGTLGLYINKAYTVVALLHIAQYTEILLLNTDHHLDAIYRYGIPAINIASTTVFFAFAIYSLYHTVRKTEPESLKWNI